MEEKFDKKVNEIKNSLNSQEKEKELQELERIRKILVSILEDAEEIRRKAEEEKNKTLVIINNLTDGLLVFDKENKLSLINPQAELFLKIKGKDIIDKTISELEILLALKPLIDSIAPEKVIKNVFKNELQIGENLILQVTATPIIAVSIIAEEEKLGNLVILHDVSREKLVERMKTEFVSLAAHQLRTPLSAIKWSLKIFLEGDVGKVSQEQAELLEKTYKSNERMIFLINDLLNITRIEEGRYLYKLTLINFEIVVQFVLNSYKEQTERKELEVEFKKPEESLPQVSIDVEKVKLAIQNLFENAIHYTPSGGKILISLESKDKQVQFSIKDTGIGIPEDQQHRVFSKFFRASNVLRKETEGTGLGLFIAKNIIEAHNGKIWFESKEDKGSTFYFTIPT